MNYIRNYKYIAAIRKRFKIAVWSLKAITPLHD